MQQALIFSTCWFSEFFFYISSKSTHNEYYSAYITIYGNVLFFDAVVWVLSKKKNTNIFMLKKCKTQREANFGRPWLHMESFRKCFIFMTKATVGKILT